MVLNDGYKGETMNSNDYIEAREDVAVELGREPTEEEVLLRMVQDEKRRIDKAKRDFWNPERSDQ